MGVVMSQLNPRIGELGASVLNSRVEPVVQVPLYSYLLHSWTTFRPRPNIVVLEVKCSTGQVKAKFNGPLIRFKGGPGSFEPWPTCVHVHPNLNGKCATKSGKHQVP